MVINLKTAKALGLDVRTKPKQQRSNQGKPRKSRERKRRKPLKRQQPERKEKYRERQCRANRKQHHKLSNLSARHDTQRYAVWA
jgi:hypothetical protein